MHTTSTLDFVELDLLEAPDDGWDWLRGFGYGVAIGLIALSAT